MLDSLGPAGLLPHCRLLGDTRGFVVFAALDFLDGVAHVSLRVEQIGFERLIGRQ